MRKLLLFIALVAVASAASAQPARFGIKAGMLFNSVDVGSVDDAVSKIKSKDVGYSMGLMGRFTIPVLGIYAQPELLYNHAGYTATSLLGRTYKLSYDNIEMPVLFGLHLLFLRVNAGPVFNLTTFESDDNEFDVYRPDVGYILGAGLSLGRMDVDLRWQGYFEGKNRDFSLMTRGQGLKVTGSLITLSAAFLF